MQKVVALLLFYFVTVSIQAQDKFIIQRIEITGNKITKNPIILKELSFNEGDTLSSIDLVKRIEESEENLRNLQLFNFSSIKFWKTNQDRFKINITVIERWYIWVAPIFEISDRNFNVWWDEFKESKYTDFSRVNYGLFLKWSNFRGENEVLRLKYRRGFKEHYQLAYNKPYINTEKTLGFNTSIQMFKRKKSHYKSERNKLLFIEDTDFSTQDLIAKIDLIHKEQTRLEQKITMLYYRTVTSENLFEANSNYLANNGLTGEYLKISYTYTDDQRDFTKYPLKGNYLHFGVSQNIAISSPVKHMELIGKIGKFKPLSNGFYIGSSFKAKWCSNDFQPYFAQSGMGFNDYVRSYEYYVIDGQQFWLSKSALKFEIIEPTNIDIPYIKMEQFKKSHFAVYISLFSDIGYVVDRQNSEQNILANQVLWGNGIGLDFITYYDKIIRIEYSINKLGEKGIFLHLSNPF